MDEYEGEREVLFQNAISNLHEELKEKTSENQQLHQKLKAVTLECQNVKDELKATQKCLETERQRNKQSSLDLKKHNKELSVKNDELSKELFRLKNLDIFDDKISNLDPASNHQELIDLRNRRQRDINHIKKLKEELKKSNEKITDLESVLEAHQVEIDEQRKEIEMLTPTSEENEATNPKAKSNKAENTDANTTELLKMVDLLVTLKKKADNINMHLSSPGNKKARSDFDEQFCQLKNENNALLESITVVKLTTRSFEPLEKELLSARTQNNHLIEAGRKQALDIILKVNALFEHITAAYPKSFKIAIEECENELEGLLKPDDVYKNEVLLQEEIIKKIQNEKEFLQTVLSKQDII